MLSKNEDVDKWLNVNFEEAKKDLKKLKDCLGLDFYRIMAVFD